MDLNNLRFTSSHEWAGLESGNTYVVGITQFAAEQLGDITHMELPAVGKAVTAGQRFGEVESVKSVSDLNSPLTGVITARNEALIENLATKKKADFSLITDDPYGKGWLLKIELAAGMKLDHLMTKAQYETQVAEGH